MKKIGELFPSRIRGDSAGLPLERRADIFFSVYIPDLFREKNNLEMDGIIPEFPIRVGTIYSQVDINKSFKVDYLVKVKNERKVIFLELKTDDSSRRRKQDWYLERAQQAGLTMLLQGLLKIYQATTSKGKYEYLFEKLLEMGFVSQDNRGKFNIIQADYDIQIVYLQPNNLSNQGERNLFS